MSKAAVGDNSPLLLRDIRKLVRLHRDLGIEVYPRSPELARFLEAQVAAPAPGRPSAPGTAAQQGGDLVAGGRDPAPAGQTLADIQAEFGDCRRCPLHETRTGVVFGVGNPKAALFIVGESPPAAADEEAAEALLAKMLQAIGLSLADVYRSTVVKCQSAAQAPSLPEQIKTCLPFLLRQIDAVAPTVICAMGEMAAQSLLRDNSPLLRLRGRVHDYHGRLLIPTYPPTFLLKNPEMKKAAWIDLQLIQAKLNRG